HVGDDQQVDAALVDGAQGRLGADDALLLRAREVGRRLGLLGGGDGLEEQRVEGAGRGLGIRLQRDAARDLGGGGGVELLLERGAVGGRAREYHAGGAVLRDELAQVGGDALVEPGDPVRRALLVGVLRRAAALRLARLERAGGLVGAPERLVPRLLHLRQLLDASRRDEEDPDAVAHDLQHQAGPAPQEVELDRREERLAEARDRAVVPRDGAERVRDGAGGGQHLGV